MFRAQSRLNCGPNRTSARLPTGHCPRTSEESASAAWSTSASGRPAESGSTCRARSRTERRFSRWLGTLLLVIGSSRASPSASSSSAVARSSSSTAVLSSGSPSVFRPASARKAILIASVRSTIASHHSRVAAWTPLVPICLLARISLPSALVLAGPPSWPLRAKATPLIATEMSVLRPPILRANKGSTMTRICRPPPSRTPRSAGGMADIGSGVPAKTVKATRPSTPASAARGPATPMYPKKAATRPATTRWIGIEDETASPIAVANRTAIRVSIIPRRRSAKSPRWSATPMKKLPIPTVTAKAGSISS